MLQQILRRLPDYTVDEAKLELHHDVGIAYGYEAVPIRFTPGERIVAVDSTTAVATRIGG